MTDYSNVCITIAQIHALIVKDSTLISTLKADNLGYIHYVFTRFAV